MPRPRNHNIKAIALETSNDLDAFCSPQIVTLNLEIIWKDYKGVGSKPQPKWNEVVWVRGNKILNGSFNFDEVQTNLLKVANTPNLFRIN